MFTKKYLPFIIFLAVAFRSVIIYMFEAAIMMSLRDFLPTNFFFDSLAAGPTSFVHVWIE